MITKFKPRKKILKIRKLKDSMEYANKECKKQIDELNDSGTTCSCPFCKSNEHVTCRGSNKGNRKWVCSNPIHAKDKYFSTSTSYEAIEIYRETMAKNLCLLVQTNSNIKGIRQYNETSKYFVEFGLEALYDFINEDINKRQIKIDKDVDLVTIFFDLSGSMLARNKAIILAKIKDKVIFEIVSNSNYLTTHSLLSSIKAKLNLPKKTQVVFVSDGEKCFVDSIKHYFPDAIHIRQFHKKSCRGIIYVHFRYKKQEYTIRCIWDCVLNEGNPSKDVIKQRTLKAERKISDKERKKEIVYSELSKDIIVWKGTVYLPRGTRRKIRGKKKQENTVDRHKRKNTSTCDTPELIFRGDIEEASKLKVVKVCFKVLKKIFRGLYITSNTVETVFNIKRKFAQHRTMKFGERILVCILFCHLHLKDKSKEELINYFKEKVITDDLLMKKVLYGSGLQKNKRKKPNFLELVNKAISKKLELVIHYCDRFHRHTSRIIKPIKINTNNYDNITRIEAMCRLRKAKREFYLERIRDMQIYDPKPLLF